ncbi:thioesterase-like superfamily-domain-containing protein [Talaromyces proteolyticus]|uniref:Thioesterase-like superfamily-domain-containing protein n=1 Tax=Talaromyces proteolyticus TaxID=1131652 RepID=A0AAD4KWT1_9EURO|nr:thioesterase-like superfamily-domain-containing protein [Talaromyces proteolyticus]KAH8697749.1 thioesterase-like superfamily-domain-containing protein [Talaromyces proteolyticus]
MVRNATMATPRLLQRQWHACRVTSQPATTTLSSRLNAASFTTAPPRQQKSTSSTITLSKPHTVDPRWLTIIKRRIGKCLMFGLQPAQVDEAGLILRRIANDWRELIAGSEGFLTDETRRAVYRHNVVWGEMDVMGHVNNVTYLRYAETARVNLMRNYAIHIDPAHKTEWLNTVGNRGIGLILQSIKLDYKFPMTWPDKITVYHRLTQDPAVTLSQSSFQQEVLILSEAKQRPAARCIEHNVIYDYKLLRRAPSPPVFILDQFKRTWELQEQSKRKWQQRIADIENKVRALELDSWDREDAVEMLGSAVKS